MKGLIPGNIVPSILILSVQVVSFALPQDTLSRGSVIISHLSPDYAQAADEFVVLFNPGPDTVDLQGYELRYFTTSGSTGSAGHSFGGPFLLPPLRYVLLASRETVMVGSAYALRDLPLSSGMATTGGQLVLRNAGVPDSVVFAAAWGSISAYVAGMTDAAVWNEDGMLQLEWQDSVYARSSYNASNLEYRHVVSDSIAVLPSLSPYVPPMTGSAWMLSVIVSQGSDRDSSLRGGMDSAATDGFDPLMDAPKPPSPAGSAVMAGFRRVDLGLATGDHLLYDIRGLRQLGGTTVRWMADIFPAEAGTPVDVKVLFESLPEGLPAVLIDRGAGHTERRRGDSLTYQFSPMGTDAYPLEIVVGDSTPPTIVFQSPQPEAAFVVGRTIPVTLGVNESSGLDSLSLAFENLGDGISAQYALPIDSLPHFSWTLPRRTLTDSARLKIVARDSMGNTGTSASGIFRVVPDTVTRAFTAGWHLFSVPIDPLEHLTNIVLPNARSESTFVYEFRSGSGYHLADSLIPGRGYFLGLANPKSLKIPGRSASDTLWTQTSSGFVMVSAPGTLPVGLMDIEFIHDNTAHSYANALAAGLIAAGMFGYDAVSGAYVPADSLHPWQGYWIPVLDSGVAIRLAPVWGTPPARIMHNTRDGWSLRLSVESGGRVDSLLHLGALTRATEGFDPMYDVPAPPPSPSGGVPAAVFEHPEWRVSTGTTFLSDVRSAGSASEWIIVLRTSGLQKVTLRWKSETGVLPEDLVFVDLSGGETFNMNDRSSYSFSGGGERLMMIRTTMTSIPYDNGAPAAFRLEQNYPNPFNGSTRLSFFLPTRSTIVVAVTDMLGREVWRSPTKVFEAGPHSTDWHPEGASGVYICTVTRVGMESGEVNTAVVRMVYLK